MMEPNEYLMQLFRTIKQLEDLDLFTDVAKLSKTEFRLIREIVMDGKEGKNIISSELARRLGITRSAVSQIVTKLEQRDIVKRTASPTDRKIAYICLSQRALSAFNEQCSQANRIVEGAVKELGEKKIQLLFSVFDEFYAALGRAKEQIRHKDKREKIKK